MLKFYSFLSIETAWKPTSYNCAKWGLVWLDVFCPSCLPHETGALLSRWRHPAKSGVMSWNKLLLGSELQPILSAQSTSQCLTTRFMSEIKASLGKHWKSKEQEYNFNFIIFKGQNTKYKSSYLIFDFFHHLNIQKAFGNIKGDFEEVLVCCKSQDWTERTLSQRAI